MRFSKFLRAAVCSSFLTSAPLTVMAQEAADYFDAFQLGGIEFSGPRSGVVLVRDIPIPRFYFVRVLGIAKIKSDTTDMIDGEDDYHIGYGSLIEATDIVAEGVKILDLASLPNAVDGNFYSVEGDIEHFRYSVIHLTNGFPLLLAAVLEESEFRVCMVSDGHIDTNFQLTLTVDDHQSNISLPEGACRQVFGKTLIGNILPWRSVASDGKFELAPTIQITAMLR